MWRSGGTEEAPANCYIFVLGNILQSTHSYTVDHKPVWSTIGSSIDFSIVTHHPPIP